MQLQEKPELTPLEIADCKTGATLGPLRRPKGVGTRYRPKLEKGSACYHLMSRTAGGEFLFDDIAKEAFRKMMWRMANFAGVEVLTYCIMDNHFHILARVPDKEKWLRRFEGEADSLGERKFLKHLSIVYSKAFMAKLSLELQALRAQGNEEAAQVLLQGFKDRLCDISKFMKELKERFTRWYNKIYGRRGTLWMDRFKSVLVQSGAQGKAKSQGVRDALQADDVALMMANYIDLNPVRAGICNDPKDYRFCGYAEAVAGSKRARRGLCKVLGMPMDDWESSLRYTKPGADQYRIWLIGKAEEKHDPESGKRTRKGMNREKVIQVVENGGKLSRNEVLCCKVRYFSEASVLGSETFVSPLQKVGRATPTLGQRAKILGKGVMSLKGIRAKILE